MYYFDKMCIRDRFKFAQPNISFQYYLLIFTNFLNIITKNSQSINFKEFLFRNIVSLFISFGCPLKWWINNWHIIRVEIFSCLIETFEEIHYITESDINLELVHFSKYLCCFYFALYAFVYLWAIHLQIFFI